MLEEVQLFIYIYNLFNKLDPMETTNIALTLMVSVIITILVRACINYSKRTFLNTNAMLKKDSITHNKILELEKCHADLKATQNAIKNNQEDLQHTVQTLAESQLKFQNTVLELLNTKNNNNRGNCDVKDT